MLVYVARQTLIPVRVMRTVNKNLKWSLLSYKNYVEIHELVMFLWNFRKPQPYAHRGGIFVRKLDVFVDVFETKHRFGPTEFQILRW